MRYVTFREGNAGLRPGVIEGDRIHPIDAPSLLDYIALPASQRADRHTREDVALSSATLDAPIRPRRNAFCVGRNYLEHAKEGADALGIDLKLPSVPTFFTKATHAIAAPDTTLHLDAAATSQYDWEVELAVVVAERCKNVAESDAMRVVFGYTIFNDVSARDLQRAHGQWFKGKSLDDCAPIGPWIVSADEIGDPHDLDIALRVNGVEKQHSNTGNMIFRIPRLIAELSKGMTLEPGDVIATGTPEGVGFARTPPEFLKDGDTMELEIARIGVLRNRVSIK